MDKSKSQFQDIANIKLIVGLGNPGKEYSDTWHNAGFIFIDHLRQKLNGTHETQIVNKKEYELTEVTDGPKLLKPLTFMNNSGTVLAEFLRFHEYKPEEILIVHDDLDIEAGEFKLHKGKFPRQHNGIISIQEKTGQTDYWHLRIGVETRDPLMRSRISGRDYVLQKIDKHEGFEKAIHDAADLIIGQEKMYNDGMKTQVLNNNNSNAV